MSVRAYLYVALVSASLGILTTSCVTGECKECSGESVIYENGVEVDRSSVAPELYCGDALDVRETNNVVENTQTVGGKEQLVRTTFSCQ
ncbi:MAG: hypothetical protein SF053_06200 [Bacteroidia bacterium]|jgi:hypothetical protein|nr:hypothetical protein [Bacteroidia bacterium]